MDIYNVVEQPRIQACHAQILSQGVFISQPWRKIGYSPSFLHGIEIKSGHGRPPHEVSKEPPTGVHLEKSPRGGKSISEDIWGGGGGGGGGYAYSEQYSILQD